MSLWARQRREAVSKVNTLPGFGAPSRGGARPNLVYVNEDTALRNSAVWACLRIRADLISTFPLDSYRVVNGIAVEVPKAPVLVFPDGKHWPWMHWSWASQFDLDRVGNVVGLITERNALGLPSRVKLVPTHCVQIYQTRQMTEHRYRIDGREYTPDEVWHERQFPVPGLPVGLSPVAYAAWTLQESLTMQQFALDWFGGGAIPRARLHNTKRSLEATPKPGQTDTEARRVKDRYQATMANGDIFVHGNDWELDFMQAEAMGTEWLEGRRASVPECARYFGCPVDLIEAAIESPGTITYQSALQRNLQFLVMHLQPAIVRRESAWSDGLLPQPRRVRLNTNALLRLDPETQAKVISQRLKDKTITNDEARALYDRPPLTLAEIDQFTLLYGGPRSSTPDNASAASSDSQARNFWDQVSPYSAVPHIDTIGVS